MSGRDSGGTSISDAIGMAVIIFALVTFFMVVAIVTFLASPGMLIVGSTKLAFGLAHSERQVWVLAIALSLTILILLVFAFHDVGRGISAHLLLCAVTMIVWSVLTYGFEFRAAEALAAVFFPGFTIKDAHAAAALQRPLDKATGADRTVTEAGQPELQEVSPTAARGADAALPLQAERPPTLKPIPMASFRVALQLPLKRAYVMVRFDDREVFRCDFRPGNQDGTAALVTPPIQATAGLAVIKVWVISPDKKAADEYVVLPVELGAGESPLIRLEWARENALGARLIRSS